MGQSNRIHPYWHEIGDPERRAAIRVHHLKRAAVAWANIAGVDPNTGRKPDIIVAINKVNGACCAKKCRTWKEQWICVNGEPVTQILRPTQLDREHGHE